MSGKREKAEQLFLQGYNCAQSVLLAYCDEFGLDERTAARLASPFGGGVGGMRETCGAVSAMVMIEGLRTGYTEPSAKQEKAALYARVRTLAERFGQINGSIKCRELLENAGARFAEAPAGRSGQYYAARPCCKLVGDAAELMDQADETEEQGGNL